MNIVIHLAITQLLVVTSTYISQGQSAADTSRKQASSSWVWSSRKKEKEPLRYIYPQEVKVLTTTERLVKPVEASKPINPYNETHNPCTTKPEMPDFSKPDRRVSEAKCLEYIWKLKDRHDAKNKRKKECQNYKLMYFGTPITHGVIHGRFAQPGEFPHMVAIGWKGVSEEWIFLCGGSIISPKYMVTAAHCSRATSRDPRLAEHVPSIVRFGAKNIQTKRFYKGKFSYLITGEEYPKDVRIINITKHPKYSPPQKYFDIALMEFERPVEFDDYVQPACLWNKLHNYNFGRNISVSGWGTTKSGADETVDELRAGDLDIIDDNICNNLLQPSCNRQWCGLQEHQMCSGKLEGGVDTCQGDSGGPLQVQINLPGFITPRMYYLLGVTSFGFGCGYPNQPGVYSRIASFVDWIEGIVWPDEIASGKHYVPVNN